MKTDNRLLWVKNNIINLRVYDDYLSILVRLELIDELNNQIRKIHLERLRTR